MYALVYVELPKPFRQYKYWAPEKLNYSTRSTRDSELVEGLIENSNGFYVFKSAGERYREVRGRKQFTWFVC